MIVNDASKEVSVSPLPKPTSSGRQPVNIRTGDRLRVATNFAFMIIFILSFIPRILLQFRTTEFLRSHPEYLTLPCLKTTSSKNGSSITPTLDVEVAMTFAGQFKSAFSLD